MALSNVTIVDARISTLSNGMVLDTFAFLDTKNQAVTNSDKMARILDRIEKTLEGNFDIKKDYFQSLLRSIIYQQLSGKSANAIYRRFIDLIPRNSFLSPKEVLRISRNDMRKAGLSFQKIDYLKNLANYFEKNSFQKDDVKRMTDQEISEELTQIKGIGQWTVDMFLMFTLNRPDIMPYADLGIQKGYKKIFDMNRLPSKKEMENGSKIWSPYRTLACWYLWKIVDVDDFVW